MDIFEVLVIFEVMVLFGVMSSLLLEHASEFDASSHGVIIKQRVAFNSDSIHGAKREAGAMFSIAFGYSQTSRRHGALLSIELKLELLLLLQDIHSNKESRLGWQLIGLWLLVNGA
jgi:hypothetical protein